MGVRMEALSTDFTEGGLEITNKELDVSINGLGFFQFRKPDGDIVYSRVGNFTRDVDGNILSQSGYHLDPPLRVPQSAQQITINPDGRVFAVMSDETNPQEVGQIVIARFKDMDGLKNIGTNFYEVTQDSGDPIVDIPGQGSAGQLVQFSRERSNVDVIREMMDMIMTKNGLRLMGKAMEAGGDMVKAGLNIVS